MNVEKTQVRVLLVEDSKILAEQILELLQTVACVTSVGVVDTETEAVAAAATLMPDLLILDLHLRKGTGFGVLKGLATANCKPIVVVLTNYALGQYRERAMALGAHYFLDKSRDFGRLPDIITEVRENRSARDIGVLRLKK